MGIEVVVLVPAAVKELRKAYTALGHASREQAVVGEAAGGARFGSVEFEDPIGFVRKIGEIGRGRLHAECHFVLADAREDFGVGHVVVTNVIERREVIEHRPTIAAIHARRIVEVEHGVCTAAELHALVVRGEETAAP